MMVKNERRRVTQLLPVLGLVGLGALPSAASAQATPPVPTTFQIQEKPIQKVPTRFKLQARVSQGKIPTGDATFERVIVNLRDGTSTLCTETLSNVRVRDSVLNIDIGPSMPNCPLDDYIASKADLEFQICVNNSESCLKPIHLSSVPFSVKASYAAQAQEAHKSDVAAQCNYAHRVTADRDLFVTQEVGTGYYDFHTPNASDLLSMDGQPATGGYIQWTPVNAQNKLNICARDEGTGALQRLGELALHADSTKVGGALNVSGGLSVKQDAITNGSSQVLGNASVGQDLQVTGNVGIGGSANLSSLQVSGASSFNGNSTFAAGRTATFNGPVVFTGLVTLPSGQVVAGDSVNSSAVVDGSLMSIDIQDESLTGADILDGSIGASDLAAGSIGSAQIGDGSIQTGDIAPGAIASDRIAAGAVQTSQIANNAVVSDKLADGAVGNSKLAQGSVATANIQLGAVDGNRIANGAISNSKLAAGAVSSTNIQDGSISASDLASGSVQSWHIGNSAVWSSQVADRSLTGLDIRYSILGHAHSPDVDQVVAFDGSNGTNAIRRDTYGQCFVTKFETYRLNGFCYVTANATFWAVRLYGTQCEISCF